MLLGKRALHIGDGGAIRQLGGDPPGLATPARQLGDGVVDTGFRASYDHRAAAMIDDVERDLSSHAGTAADNNDLLGLKMHTRGPSMVLLDGSDLTGAVLSTPRNGLSWGARRRANNPARFGSYSDCGRAG